jgi:hypothetical protein
LQVSNFEFKFKLFDGPEEFLPAMHRVKKLLRESNFTTGDRFSTVWGKVLGNWVTDEVSTERSIFGMQNLSSLRHTFQVISRRITIMN